MKIGLRLTILLNGRKVYDEESHSFVQNFAKLLYGFAQTVVTSSTISVSVTDVNGSPQSIYTEWYGGTLGGGTPAAMNAPAGDDSFGIVVGSGTKPVSYNDYSLAKKIYNGSEPGKLSYGPTGVSDVYVDTTRNLARFTISRTFTNLSNSPVSVSEVGIVARSYWRDSSGVKQDIKYLIVRDVIDPPITVPPNGTLTVVYTFEVSL